MEAVRNFETHNLNVVFFFFVFLFLVCSGLRKPSVCVWDREDRQKATGQVSCPGPWLGQIGSWIWAYQTGRPFGFWLPGGPSCTRVVLGYSQCQEHTVSKCVYCTFTLQIYFPPWRQRNPFRHHNTKVSKRKHPPPSLQNTPLCWVHTQTIPSL